MPVEIERKFLVTDDSWRMAAGPGERLCQGYLAQGEQSSVRIRLAGERAWLTVKGVAPGISRPEFEYAIPVADAEAMLGMCPQPLVTKTRYRVPYETLIWEVDVFEGHAAGLIMAEVELSDADQTVSLPPWAGREVSDDPAYRNAAIAIRSPLEPLTARSRPVSSTAAADRR
ncbi:CYTH domain-containing protein [Novosphingobium rosa]|uniref:CYTH domain-containing protein n=1 Tax=Novosphingobium rosa TaxID=76978 RepID=UPI0008338322|nr:CYTH domain-containing protein [Novosphingobium rosa]